MFTLIKTHKEARAGLIHTAHGEIPTPVFAPIGTCGAVKSLEQEALESLDVNLLLANTWHLYLRPGHELIEQSFGGLHGFMSWSRPLLTDSGGFQVYSLKGLLDKVSEDGVVLKSHWDGSSHHLTPEKSMEIQRALGADIVMAFDYCTGWPGDKSKFACDMELSLAWAERSRRVALRDYQNFFAIVQGGLYLDLRVECLERLKELNPEGFALGGLSVGEKDEQMEELCRSFVPRLPKNKPRYLMGVGTPLNILTAIKAGVDIFDCVIPTRNGRNGQVFTRNGPFNIKKECFKEDTNPLEEGCHCSVCRRYSRSYLRHLFKGGESLSGRLITMHNIHFYLRLMEKVRKTIQDGTFDDFYCRFYNQYTKNS